MITPLNRILMACTIGVLFSIVSCENKKNQDALVILSAEESAHSLSILNTYFTEGENVSLPTVEGEITATVTKVEYIAGSETLNFLEGRLEGVEGKFLIARKGSAYTGFLFSSDGTLSYEFSNDSQQFEERALKDLVCVSEDATNPHTTSLGLNTKGLIKASQDSSSSSVTLESFQGDINSLSSLEGAPSVIYLNFNGTNNYYIGWGYVDALPSGLSNDEIYDIWKRVSDDFAMFNINVTTDKSAFNAAAVEKRISCIITPSEDVLGTNGGLAYIGSFSWRIDIPCWTKPYTGHNGAQLISHEVGHTLGLKHDGDLNSSYYAGHEVNGLKWGPIMGVAFNKDVNHWSKGEYKDSSNQEDDIAIILSNEGVDLHTDEVGDTILQAEVMTADASLVEGFIENQVDLDVYEMSLSNGQLVVEARNAFTGANLDLELKLLNESGNLVVSVNPSGSFDATLTATVEEGTYFLVVNGAGSGSPLNGYSDYSSTGAYALTSNFDTLIEENQEGVQNGETGGSTTGAGEEVDTNSVDTDGDGYSDSYEVLTGTNPTDATSNLNIQVSYEDGDFCCVLFQGTAGKSYSVLVSHNMVDWDEVQVLTAQNNGEQLHYKQPFNGEHSVFYKVVPTSSVGS